MLFLLLYCIIVSWTIVGISLWNWYICNQKETKKERVEVELHKLILSTQKENCQLMQIVIYPLTSMTIFIDAYLPWGLSSIQEHLSMKWVRTCFMSKWWLANCRNNYPADWIYSDAIPTSSFWVQRRSATNCQREERWEFTFSCIVVPESQLVRVKLGERASW